MIDKVFFAWLAFATLMALITAIINMETIKDKEKEHWVTWVSLPVWFTGCMLICVWRKVFYKEPMKRFFISTYDSLFVVGERR